MLTLRHDAKLGKAVCDVLVTLEKLRIIIQNILRNVSLQLPENFELIAGTKIQNIHLYYKLISVTVMGDAHGIKLFINVL